MQVSIWSSYSCNNSSDYRLVARFEDATVAARVGEEVREFLSAYADEFDRLTEENDYTIPDEPIPVALAFADRLGFEWDGADLLTWGDEGLACNVPDVAVAGGTVALYHDYCGGFTVNLVRALEARGAKVEPEDSAPPDLSVRLVLPKGEAGERMASELATFLAQGAVHEHMGDFTVPPPWGEQRLMGDGSEIVWFREGERFAFKMPFNIAGFPALKAYLAASGATEVDVRLCDERELAYFDMKETLDDLDRRVASGGIGDALDLTDKRLRFIPPRVFELPHLRRLVLDDNPLLRALPDDLSRLASLEELSVAGAGLTSLPGSLARLGRLSHLDISRNEFSELPPVVSALPELRVLRADRLRVTRLAPLAACKKLEELKLSGLRPREEGALLPFPREILELGALRSLDLSSSALADIPDDITRLGSLEALNLNAALGQLTRLPPLHELPKLTSLLMDGRAGNTGKYPPHAVLEGVWRIATLEHLGIDRYGEEKGKRSPLTSLPADAFARLTRLRTLDVSFNPLTTLPESFFALTSLERVDLRYTKLDRATLDRLAATFPRVRFDLRNVTTRFDVDDPNWRAVREKVQAAAAKLRSDRAAALEGFEAALAFCTPGAVHSDYDELYALYGAVDALTHLRQKAEKDARAALDDKLIAYATRALELVPAPGTIWHFTDEGAFQEEVTRRTGNALAWTLMERGDLDRALAIVERALSAGGDRGYIFDTKVRILLRAGKCAEAYTIVDAILAEDPSFDDFQDVKASDAFRAWKAGA